MSQLHCNFCGRPQYEVGVLIAGPTVMICDGCVEDCQPVIDRTLRTPPELGDAEYRSWSDAA